MLITTLIRWDIETGLLLEWEGYDYEGPLELAKGDAAKAQDLANQKTASGWAPTLFNTSQQAQSEVLPFFSSELTNPQGLGVQGTQQAITQGGQSLSGAKGSALEGATLNAARSGNPSSLTAVQDKINREGMAGSSNIGLDVALKNAELKQAQQQAGAQGLGSLSGQDITGALNSLGEASNASNAWANANTSAWGPFENIFGDLTKAGSQIGAAALSGGGGSSSG